MGGGGGGGYNGVGGSIALLFIWAKSRSYLMIIR